MVFTEPGDLENKVDIGHFLYIVIFTSIVLVWGFFCGDFCFPVEGDFTEKTKW